MRSGQTKYQISARLLEVLIGLYFFAGALPKALDIDKFVVQMSAYHVIESATFLEPAVLFTVFLEIVLGWALIFGIRLKGLTILALQGITILFSALIIYAWRVHGLEDCGCFPIFKMSPPVSLFKNTLILSGSYFILWQLVIKIYNSSDESASHQQAEPAKQYCASNSNKWKILKLALSIVIALAFVGFAWNDLDRVALGHDDSQEGIFAQFEIFSDQGYFNLAEGWHMVPVMSTSCPECKEKVPELNELFLVPELPPMIAICYEDTEGDLETFKALTGPIFPTYSIGDRALLYFRLIDKDPFRFVLVRNGIPLGVWDGYVPLPDEIMLVMSSADEV